MAMETAEHKHRDEALALAAMLLFTGGTWDVGRRTGTWILDKDKGKPITVRLRLS